MEVGHKEKSSSSVTNCPRHHRTACRQGSNMSLEGESVAIMDDSEMPVCECDQCFLDLGDNSSNSSQENTTPGHTRKRSVNTRLECSIFCKKCMCVKHLPVCIPVCI